MLLKLDDDKILEYLESLQYRHRRHHLTQTDYFLAGSAVFAAAGAAGA
jgi:hypothetical protein